MSSSDFLINNKMNELQNLSNFSNKSGNISSIYDYENEDSSLLMMSSRMLLTFTILWSLISFIGIFANLSVVAVMLCGSKLTSATQYFIVNLAISDTLFLAICPTLALVNLHRVIIYDHLPTFFAKVICKSDYFSTHVNIFIKDLINLLNELNNF